MSSPLIGTTFSHPHLKYLKLPIDESLDLALDMHFSHLRLGSYWSEVEPSENSYDFSVLFDLLARCQKVGQKVILTLGAKSPRWPEFHYPNYLNPKTPSDPETQSKTLKFIEKTIIALKHFSCITHWQVENEPLDPSGPNNLSIPLDFLETEVAQVRSLDPRPILLTLWGNDLRSRQLFPQILPLADLVGIDIYYRQFVKKVFGKSFYSGPATSDKFFRQLTKNSPKKIIITELQAEPWEGDEAGYFSPNPKSISPQRLQSNLDRATSLGVDEILLWGFEYWCYQKSLGNSDYFEVIKSYNQSR